MQQYHIVYIITNKINNKFYIGAHSTFDLNDNYMGSGKLIKNAIKKHGIENFDKKILEFCNSNEEMYLKEKEIVTLDLIKSDKSYNLKVGGTGPGSGEEHFFYGLKRPDHSKKILGKNNPMFGKNHSEETKTKISKVNKGRKHTDEINKKKGRFGEENAMFGKLGTATGKKWINNGIESKLVKLNECFLDQGWSLGRLPDPTNITKPVFKINIKTEEIIEEYCSLKEAAEKTNTHRSSISSCCNGKLKSSNGFKWKFKI